MTVEQLIALLNTIGDKTKIVAMQNDLLVFAVEELTDHVVLSDLSKEEQIVEVYH